MCKICGDSGSFSFSLVGKRWGVMFCMGVLGVNGKVLERAAGVLEGNKRIDVIPSKYGELVNIEAGSVEGDLTFFEDLAFIFGKVLLSFDKKAISIIVDSFIQNARGVSKFAFGCKKKGR
ncbi:hypothetical protein AMTRI_Chr13g86590 [Amborella trichopoda]